MHDDALQVQLIEVLIVAMKGKLCELLRLLLIIGQSLDILNP